MKVVAGFAADGRGAVLRDYAVAVIVAAGVVILTMTLLADSLYRVYLRAVGP